MAQGERLRHGSNGFDAVDPFLLWQQSQSDRGLHLEAEVAEPPQGQAVGLPIDGLDLHRAGTTFKPALMVIQVASHHRLGRQHLHRILEVAAVAAHLRVGTVKLIVGFSGRQDRHGWGAAGGGRLKMNQCKALCASVFAQLHQFFDHLFHRPIRG